MDTSSVTLVFHPVCPSSGQDSAVFAEAARRVLEAAPDGEARLVSPYIALTVLAKLVETRPFRLVTDLNACFEKGGDHDLIRFVSENRDFVRDVTGVHAKVISTDGAVLLGSANLTASGFASRDEMGCLILDVALIGSIRAWFNGLWKIGAPVTESEIKSLQQRITNRVAPPPADRAGQKRSRRNARRTLGWMKPRRAFAQERNDLQPPLDVSRDQPFTAERNELAAQLRNLTTSRPQAEEALRLLARALAIAELPVEDDRLHLNFGRTAICVCINQRYVAWLHREARTNKFAFILDNTDTADRVANGISDAKSGRFQKRGSDDSPTLHVPLDRLGEIPECVYQSWEGAIRLEVGRTRKDGRPYKSGYLRSKRPFLYDALTADSLRREIARRAFPAHWWFGVNNSSRGHVNLYQIRPLLNGNQAQFVWPVGHSTPRKLYREMEAGDRVLIWTGHGRDPSWGLLGTATLSSVAAADVVLAECVPFAFPITPYPMGQPQATEEVHFLRDTFCVDLRDNFPVTFEPLGDVMHTVFGSKRTRPITVYPVTAKAFGAVRSFAEHAKSRR